MRLAIVGFGASGLFCALELKDSNFEVDIYDVGPDFTKRVPCPIDMGKIERCPPCKYCSVYSSGGIYNDGKCLKFDSQILLSDGSYKTIQYVYENKIKNIMKMTENHKIIPGEVSDWIDSGELICFNLITKNNNSISVSEFHPFYTLDGWKKVTDIKKGDFVAVASKLSTLNNLCSKKESEFIIIGSLLSDGCLTHGLSFANIDSSLREYLKKHILKLFPEAYFVDYSDKFNISGTVSNKSRIRQYLRDLNLLKKNAHTKEIPEFIFKGSNKKIAKFLGAFYACDGWVSNFENHNEIGVSLVNLKMINQLYSLLLRFNIKAMIYHSNVKYKGRLIKKYTLSIKCFEDIVSFYNNIEIPLKSKQNKIKEILGKFKKNRSPYMRNLPKKLWSYIFKKCEEKNIKENELFRLVNPLETNLYYEESEDRYRITSKYKPLKKHDINPKLLKTIGYILNDAFLISLSDGDISFEEVKDIENIGKQQCYDLTVIKEHNFIADNFIVHNTITNASRLIGGNLWDLIGEKKLQENIDTVVQVFQNAGANNQITVPNKDDIQWIESRAISAGMVYGYQELLHMGSDKLPSIIKNIYSEISSKFNFIWRTKVENIYKQDTKYLVEDNKGNKKEYDILVISAGRSGSSWVMNTNIYPSFKTEKGRVDIGVRLETSNEVMHEINNRFYEAKLYYKAPTFGDIVRSFCSNPSGFVCIENNKDYSVVNGHAKNDEKSKNTNFAILVSKTFTEPFKSPVKYGNAVASLANMLGGGPLVQRYGDLKRGRRTKDLTFNSIQPTLSVTSGDLSLVFPYRILKSIMEYIEAADKISPGLASDDTLLYGVEAKYFTEKIKVTEHMEALDNCYVIGDVSGHTRGISQSCVSGVLAGNHLKNKFKSIL